MYFNAYFNNIAMLTLCDEVRFQDLSIDSTFKLAFCRSLVELWLQMNPGWGHWHHTFIDIKVRTFMNSYSQHYYYGSQTTDIA